MKLFIPVPFTILITYFIYRDGSVHLETGLEFFKVTSTFLTRNIRTGKCQGSGQV